MTARRAANSFTAPTTVAVGVNIIAKFLLKTIIIKQPSAMDVPTDTFIANLAAFSFPAPISHVTHTLHFTIKRGRDS